MSAMLNKLVFAVLAIIALAVSGCGGGVDNSAPIPPSELDKIKTTPLPEKSPAGKPNMNKPIAD